MGILREGLYSDKVLAILREYSSNAWDAHRSVGKHELPIKVTLPTYDEPVLRIRDYGPGLSHDAVFTVYTQYGRSTKRDSDDVVGMLGIGSKSGFAYSDSFTITTWHGGIQRIYVATLGDDEKGAINLLSETPCDLGDTGVEIQIATKPEDRREFESTARRLFKHMTPRPEINIELPALPDERTVLTNGVITPGGDGGWIAVMGCVPYRVNLSQLDERQVSKCLPNLSGVLTFGIGGVAVSASREELKYTTATKTALVEKFNALVDEFVTHALQQLEAGVFTGWETRLRVQVLAKLDLPLPEKWKPFAEGFAKVTYTPDDFVIIHNKSACTRLTVTANTRLLVDDTGNELSGYSLGHDDYVVRATNKTPEELRTLLDTVLATSGLTGVKIELLSTLYWTAPVVPVKKKTNPKHRARMFRLDPEGPFNAPWSDHWEAELRVPTKDDVYVLIEGFKAQGYAEFFTSYREDCMLAEAFGATMPAVYGYKTTEKKPVDATKIEGTRYREWRKTFITSLLTPERIELIALYWRANLGEDDRYSQHTPDSKELKWLVKQLGEQHPVVALHADSQNARQLIKEKPALRQLALRAGLTFDKSAASVAFSALNARYPLLRRAGFRDLWHVGYYDDKGIRNEWVDYVKMCDERIERDEAKANNVVQLVSVP
jgi:hypothetical protein